MKLNYTQYRLNSFTLLSLSLCTKIIELNFWAIRNTQRIMKHQIFHLLSSNTSDIRHIALSLESRGFLRTAKHSHHLYRMLSCGCMPGQAAQGAGYEKLTPGQLSSSSWLGRTGAEIKIIQSADHRSPSPFLGAYYFP